MVLFLIEIHGFQELKITMEQKGIWLLSFILVLGISVLTEGKSPPRKYFFLLYLELLMWSQEVEESMSLL